MKTCLYPFLAAALVSSRAQSANADIDIRVGGGANCFTSSIQTAINSVVAGGATATDIKIARDIAYNAQQLEINGRNVRLIGGYQDCNQAAADTTKTVLNGAGGSANTVVTVRGVTTVVAFQNLEVTGGDEVTSSNGRGGGFTVAGGPHAQVDFDNVLIHDNQAGYGGGIYIDNEFSSNPADVFVHMGDNVSINANYGAYGGGGIWCRNSRVHLVGSNTFVIFNSTASTVGAIAVNGPGGGIRAQNCEMNLAGGGLLGTVSFNTAGGSGGGISVTGERAIVKVYSRSSSVPAAILGNTALGVGGGIDVGSSARVTAWDAIVDGNRSYTGGGAISVFDNDGDGALVGTDQAQLTMIGRLVNAPDDPNFGGVAVLCVPALNCNRISNNSAIDADNQRMPGAAARVYGDGADTVTNTVGEAILDLLGTRLLNNEGESLIRVYLPGPGLSSAYLNGTLIAGNIVTGALLHNPDDPFDGGKGSLDVAASTIAGNSIGGGEVVRTTGKFSLIRSIVWQPGKHVAAATNGDAFNPAYVTYLLANDLTGVPASTHNLQVDPQFVDAAAGDFSLKLSSPAVDFAPGAADEEVDRRARVKDLNGIVNEFGAQDLGAYERQFTCSADTIFCSGFEY